MLDPTRGQQPRKSRVPSHQHQKQQQQPIVPQPPPHRPQFQDHPQFQVHNQPHFYPAQHHHHQVFAPPIPPHFQQPPPLVRPPGIPRQTQFPQWHHHPDIPYKSPEPRNRSRTNSGKKRPTLRIAGDTAADVEVHQGHGGSNGVGPGLGGPHQGRSRSRAGSISIPAYVDMSPSVEKTYNFGHPQHHQVHDSGDNATYVQLCFPPPTKFGMNGSQPCLNSLPLTKGPGPTRFKRNGSQPCLRGSESNFKRQLSTPVDDGSSKTKLDVNGGVNGVSHNNRSLPKSASFDETQTQTALDVVRTKRAKQLLNQEKVTRQSSSVSGHSASTARTTKSGLVMSGDYTERTVGCADMRGDYTERTVGCADMVAEKVTRSSKTPTPHHSRPTTPQRSPSHLSNKPVQDVGGIMLSPETALPPPPSPPCTCGKVLADMGPPPTVDEWDNHSIDSKGTLESRRSQGYVSMTSASTYLIDATGADPVLVHPHQPPELAGYRDQYPDHQGQMFGYSMDGGGLMSHQSHLASDRVPLCGTPAPVTSMPRSRPRWCSTCMKENCGCSLSKSIIKKTSFPRQPNGNLSNGGTLNLKKFSVNSDENERGVTFRIGKFIGQVTIESVKFRRQHWLFLLICLLVFVIILSIYLPIASRVDNIEDPEYRLMVIHQMLREVPLIDGHNDLAWNIRQFIHNKLKTVNFSSDLTQVEPWSQSKWSHTDIPRLIKGKIGAQLWVAYAPCGSQHKDAVQITLEQIDLIKRFIEQYKDNLQYVTSSEGLVEAHKLGKIASVISVESGHSIGTSLAVLRMYYRLGARSLTLTHNCNNPWADSSLVDKEGNMPVHNGLTPFGKTVINEMNRLGMIVDLSHSSVKTALDTLEISEAPVIFSHSSAQFLCNSTRNVPDHLLKKAASKRGLVMINFFSYFITCKNVSTTSDVIAHINHIREVAGIDSVGIGASYDGINEVPTGLEDVSKYVDLFSALYASGKWSVQELKQLAGLNFLRVWREVENVGRRMSGEEDILEDRIPAEDMLNVPNDCKSGGHKDKRSAQDSSDC